MKLLTVTSVIAAIALSQAAFAQNQTSTSQAAQQPSSNSGQNTSPGQQNLAAAQKIEQDLKKAGFTDIKVVAESFVVQAKSKDGNPVLMTIGPHGMSVFEAQTVGSGPGTSQSGTTGSGGSQTGNK
jgi:hypothetical protein